MTLQTDPLYTNGLCNIPISFAALLSQNLQFREFYPLDSQHMITSYCSPYQKTFGYPDVDVCEYSKRELQELFLKKCRFEQRLHFDTERTRLLYRIYFQNYIRILLQKIRMLHHIESRNDQI